MANIYGIFKNSKLQITMLDSTNLVTGLILAGGKGVRVGEQDKGLLYYHGTPMIERQISWFSSQVSRIIISANRNLAKYRAYSYPVYSDKCDSKLTTFSGPLAGIYTGLNQCETEWLFVQPVDMPLLPQNIISKIYQSVINDIDVYYLKSSERSHYLSMLISKRELSRLAKYLYSGQRKARGFLEEVDAIAIDLGIDERMFANLNEKADYQ